VGSQKVSYNSSFLYNSKKGLRFKHDKYASEQTEVSSIIYNLEKFSKVFFTYLYSLFFFYIMYIFWTHLFRIIISFTERWTRPLFQVVTWNHKAFSYSYRTEESVRPP